MPPIGETLREARMRQKLDIADVEARTKIRAKYLRALENEEFGMLPGPTYVRTFLRTYAELLGLDPHLLVEEYRLHHEPGGDPELQPLASPPRAGRRERRAPMAGGGGPPGFGTLVAAFLVLVVAVLLVLGITGGSSNDNSPQIATTTTATQPAQRRRHRRRPARAPATGVALVIKPTVPTYACVDTGPGTTVVFEGILQSARTFRNRKGQLRVNLGKSSVGLAVNGKPVSLQPTPNPIGIAFGPKGQRQDLPAGQRPCA